MKEKLLFFKKYLSQTRHIGAIVPSSRYLARAVCRAVDLSSAKLVVELGGGTGVLTEEITRQTPQKCDLVIVERDDEFARLLQDKFNDSHVWATEAQNMHHYLEEHNFKQVDCFISGLPFLSLPKEVNQEIMEVIQQYLSPNGVFVAYSYFANTYFFFKRFFPNVKVDFVMRNFPPAFVYRCTKNVASTNDNGSQLQVEPTSV